MKCTTEIWISCNLHALVLNCQTGKERSNLGDSPQVTNGNYINVSDISLIIPVSIKSKISDCEFYFNSTDLHSTVGSQGQNVLFFPPKLESIATSRF